MADQEDGSHLGDCEGNGQQQRLQDRQAVVLEYFTAFKEEFPPCTSLVFHLPTASGSGSYRAGSLRLKISPLSGT